MALRMIIDAMQLSWSSIDREGLNVNTRDLALQKYSSLFPISETRVGNVLPGKSRAECGETMSEGGTAVP